MAYIKRMKAQDNIDKTREYLNYLEEHIENVRKAFEEISRACKGMWWVTDDCMWHNFRSDVEHHDLSKFSPEEFVQYRRHFYPVDDREKSISGIDEAWANHKIMNPHHHEEVERKLDVVHMIIDWTAMGYKFGDTAQKYYEKNKDRINLDEEYVALMYEIFEKLKECNE